MAKEIQIKIESDCYNLAPVKIERKKIYGWTEIKALDPNGNGCKQVSLDSNGTTIIPSGAIKLGLVADNGSWIDKSELHAVHSDGTIAELCPSTFETGITLEKKATNEEFLNLLAVSVYVLSGEGSEELASKVGDDIYSIRFNYRTDYEDMPAFLISNGKSLFVVAGTEAKFEYLSLEEQADLDVNEEEAEVDIDDLDFSFM